jgi:hypothetical protein
MEKSGLLPRLLELAQRNVAAFGPLEVTLTLDGVTRLKLQPPAAFLDALALQVRPSLSPRPGSPWLWNKSCYRPLLEETVWPTVVYAQYASLPAQQLQPLFDWNSQD